MYLSYHPLSAMLVLKTKDLTQSCDSNFVQEECMRAACTNDCRPLHQWQNKLQHSPKCLTLGRQNLLNAQQQRQLHWQDSHHGQGVLQPLPALHKPSPTQVQCRSHDTCFSCTSLLHCKDTLFQASVHEGLVGHSK
jgi:hypothetical protein